MSILKALQENLKRRDEKANVKLAQMLAKKGDNQSINEIVDLLSGSNKALKADAIKILYEVGEIEPKLIQNHTKVFLALLTDSSNRIRWGAMHALSCISVVNPVSLISSLPLIMEDMDTWTVITRDNFMKILYNIAQSPKGQAIALPLMVEQLYQAPVNQFPRYAEWTAACASKEITSELKAIIKSRDDVMVFPAKAKKLNSILKLLDSKR